MSDQLVNRPKFIDPQLDPLSCVVAYTRCLPLYGTEVKSFSDAQPDFGFASAPVELQRYVDGSEQVPPVGPVVGPVVGVEPTGTSCHCWLEPPWSLFCTTRAPSVVAEPWTASALPLVRLISRT